MISIFAALNGSILSGARVPYAAARDGLFFRSIARVHPQFHTPGVSILALSAWAALLVLVRHLRPAFHLCDFRQLAALRDDHGRCPGAPQKTAGFAAALFHLGLPRGTSTVRCHRSLSGDFHPI